MRWKFVIYVEDRGEQLDILEILDLCKEKISSLHPKSLIYRTEVVKD